MEIKREFEITYSYEYDERLERRNSFFFLQQKEERLLETKVKDERLGDIIMKCFQKYFSKGNPVPYFDEEELDSDQEEQESKESD